MTKKNKGNILVIGDTHIPYVHKDYLKFCKKVQKDMSCTRVVHIGDIVDNHAMSYHEHVPELDSASAEMRNADKILKLWFKAFPDMDICIGNHDALPERKMRTNGLPLRYLKDYKAALNAPDGWNWHQELELDGVLFRHTPLGYTLSAMLRGAEHLSQNMVSGHVHSVGGVAYSANNKQLFFALAVGCGVDRHALAFDYGKLNKFKPILGCGVVHEGGRTAEFIPMDLGRIL